MKVRPTMHCLGHLQRSRTRHLHDARLSLQLTFCCIQARSNQANRTGYKAQTVIASGVQNLWISLKLVKNGVFNVKFADEMFVLNAST